MIKIEIKGPIIPSNHQSVYDWYGMEATSPKKVNNLLKKADGKEIQIEINSGGGSVFAGAEIYTALRSYKGKTSGTIVGLAASAASVIAMGVDDLEMSPLGHIMIHNSSSYSEGDYRNLEHEAEVLKSINKTIATAYEQKTGKNLEELLTMMDYETWMDSKKAKELGFIDKIMFEDNKSNFNFVANGDTSGVLPTEVINKTINLLSEKNLQDQQEINHNDKKIENKQDTIKNLKNEQEILKAKLDLEIESSYFYGQI